MRCASCPVAAGLPCPLEGLPRHCADPRFRALAARRDGNGDARPALGDEARALLPLVSACPDRGGVLPVSLQPEGCGCGELSECRAGRGRIAGRVSLQDCLHCVSAPRVPGLAASGG